MDDPTKALRHKLLAVPEYRERYLRYVRDIARDALDWTKIEPKIGAWRALIGPDVEADTQSDGTVKVLDVGLAKTHGAGSEGSSGAASESPTLTSPAMTAMGLILGTAA